MENAFQSGRAPSSLGEPLLGGISFLCWPMGDPPLSLSLWTPKASPAPGLLPGTLWGASKASAMLTLGAWMGQCQGQVTQERVSEQERVSHCHSEQQESWGLASLAWRSEALLTRPPAPRSLAGCLLTSAWTLGGALHPVLGSSWPPAGQGGWSLGLPTLGEPGEP